MQQAAEVQRVTNESIPRVGREDREQEFTSWQIGIAPTFLAAIDHQEAESTVPAVATAGSTARREPDQATAGASKNFDA
jgi:hypothetical protein